MSFLITLNEKMLLKKIIYNNQQLYKILMFYKTLINLTKCN